MLRTLGLGENIYLLLTSELLAALIIQMGVWVLEYPQRHDRIQGPWRQRWNEKLETRIPTWQSGKRGKFRVLYSKLSPKSFISVNHR